MIAKPVLVVQAYNDRPLAMRDKKELPLRCLKDEYKDQDGYWLLEKNDFDLWRDCEDVKEVIVKFCMEGGNGMRRRRRERNE